VRFDRRLFINFDWTFFLLILIILSIGLVNLYSAGFAISQDTSLCLKQGRWIILGFICMIFAFSVDYRSIVRHAYLIYGVTILLLIVVLLYGYVIQGSQRWIVFMGFSFQPSELMKLSVIIILAKYFDENKLNRPLVLKDMLYPGLMAIVPFLLILRQPDLGTALIVLIIFMSIVLFVGVNWKTLSITSITGVLLLPLAWFALKDYQKGRIITFLAPENDPLGAGYHIIQSMIAIGSGEWWGKGFLKGTQTHLRFLPEQQTDFVFSVFAEEWGFIGVLVLMILFFSLIAWGLKISLQAKDYLGTLVAFGITMFVAWSVLINVGMVLGLLPVVGVPLPFMSYGGSSVVVLLTAMGLMLNISMRRFLLHS